MNTPETGLSFEMAMDLLDEISALANDSSYQIVVKKKCAGYVDNSKFMLFQFESLPELIRLLENAKAVVQRKRDTGFC